MTTEVEDSQPTGWWMHKRAVLSAYIKLGLVVVKVAAALFCAWQGAEQPLIRRGAKTVFARQITGHQEVAAALHTAGLCVCECVCI